VTGASSGLRDASAAARLWLVSDAPLPALGVVGGSGGAAGRLPPTAAVAVGQALVLLLLSVAFLVVSAACVMDGEPPRWRDLALASADAGLRGARRLRRGARAGARAAAAALGFAAEPPPSSAAASLEDARHAEALSLLLQEHARARARLLASLGIPWASGAWVGATAALAAAALAHAHAVTAIAGAPSLFSSDAGIPADAWVVAIASLFLVGGVARAIQRSDAGERAHAAKRARLLFDTRLGMYSPR
jgi:hypothetical protein